MQPLVKLIFDGIETKRFHTVATIRQETVGHHTGLVMALLLSAYPQIRRAVIQYAALHDLAECEVGDTPSPVKRTSPEVKTQLDALEDSVYRQAGIELPTLDRFERMAFKRCDNAAGMMSCHREYLMGNTQILIQYTNFKTYYDLLRDGAKIEAEVGAVPSMWAPYAEGNKFLDQAVSDMDLRMGGLGYAECWSPYVADRMEERRTGIAKL